MRFHIRANWVAFVYLVGMGNVGSEENMVVASLLLHFSFWAWNLGSQVWQTSTFTM